MMGVVGLVLLIACVNLANLLLAQSATREKEMSIRAAMGAGRGRIVRQLLTESVLLAVARRRGSGMVVAYWGRTALWSFRPPFLGNASIDLSFEPRVLLFTAGVSLLTGILFGLAPAIRVSRTNLNDVLKSGGRTGAASAGSNRIRSLLVDVGDRARDRGADRRGPVRAQHAGGADAWTSGFDSAHIGFIALNPGQQRYDQAHGQQFYLDAMAKARAVPGVEAATVASAPPLGGGTPAHRVSGRRSAESELSRLARAVQRRRRRATSTTLRIPMREGRDFTEFDRRSVEGRGDRERGAGAASSGRARMRSSKRFTIVQNTTLFEVVGVVATSVINAVGEDPTPMIYRPMRQEYAPGRGAAGAHEGRSRAAARRRARPGADASTAACRCAARARCSRTSRPGCGRRGWARRCSASSAASRCCSR